jgi:hypothetical protein
MRFKVGPHVYTIRISSGQLRDSDRVAVDGLCCWSDCTIWINERLPLAQRVTVLFHELAHAYEMEFGIPADSEGHANRMATFARDVLQQLDAQRGIDALLRLRPDGVIDDSQSQETPSETYAVKCGECGSLIAIGSVTTPPARFDAASQRPVVDRVATCADCGCRTCWTEDLTAGGKPNGRVLAGPIVRRRGRRALAHSLS